MTTTDSPVRDDYGAWFREFVKRPSSGGTRGFGLLLSALGLGLFATAALFVTLPPGRYPRLLLILPGLGLGLLGAFVAGRLFYKIPGVMALGIGSAAFAACVVGGWRLVVGAL